MNDARCRPRYSLDEDQMEPEPEVLVQEALSKIGRSTTRFFRTIDGVCNPWAACVLQSPRLPEPVELKPKMETTRESDIWVGKVFQPTWEGKIPHWFQSMMSVSQQEQTQGGTFPWKAVVIFKSLLHLPTL